MPAAASRPPPVANSRQSASAPRLRHGARTLTVYPPCACGREHRVRACGMRQRELVAERAAHAAAPRGIGQQVHRRARRAQRRARRRAPDSRSARRASSIVRSTARAADEAERVGVGAHDPVELRRMDDQVGLAVAVRVVGEVLAELAQHGLPLRVERERRREVARRRRRDCRRTRRRPPRRDARRRRWRSTRMPVHTPGAGSMCAASRGCAGSRPA